MPILPLDNLPIEIRNRIDEILRGDLPDEVAEQLDDLIADLDAVSAAYLDEAQVFTANQYVAPVALTFGADVAVNAALGNVFTLTLSGATAELSNPTNLAVGMSFMFVVTQDAVGGRALTFDTSYTFGEAGTPDFTTSVANVVDVVSALVVSPTKIACTVLRGF